MTTITLFFSFAGLLLAAYAVRLRFPRRSRSRSSKSSDSRVTEVLVYTGHTLRTVSVKEIDEGITWGKAVFPPELLIPFRFSDGVERLLLPIEPVELAKHRTMESARDKILMGRVFKPGGDIIETVRLVGSVAVIVVSVFLWMQLSSLNGTIVQMSVRLTAMEETLSKPLNIRPIPQASPVPQ